MPVRVYIVLLAMSLTLTVACGQGRIVYTDVNAAQATFSELLDSSPDIVIATVEDVSAIGPVGYRTRPAPLPQVQVQKHLISLRIRAILKGALTAGQRVDVTSYDSAAAAAIGPPQGVVGSVGSTGIYFLRRVGTAYRTMVDIYRMWIPLGSAVDLDLVVPNDIPLTIWRILLYGSTSRTDNPANIDLSSLEEWTGYRLGRARTVELLTSIAAQTNNPDMQIEACIRLNETHRGCGGERCLTAILADQSRVLSQNRRRRLAELLEQVTASNAELLADLRGGRIENWARSRNPAEIHKFLALLTLHPDLKIAGLATKQLVERTNTRPQQ